MIKYIILGVVQGVTEFFPVSSSAHLVMMQKILGVQSHQLALDVILHLGTSLSLLIFFFKDILAALRNIRFILLIIVVTLITGVIGIAGKNFFESLFSSVGMTAGALMVTGIILIATRGFRHSTRKTAQMQDAAAMGLAQGVAIIPGISRSGITISALLFLGMEAEAAFRFSFLAAIPAIWGAVLLEAKDIGAAAELGLNSLLAGFISSFLTGIIALYWLRIILKQAKWHYFGYYCLAAGLAAILFLR